MTRFTLAISSEFLIKCFVVLLPGLINNTVFPQKTTIRGYITDENNFPYEGASVILNRGEFGTISNVKGSFLFENLPAKEYEIAVTAVGYKKETIVFNADTLRNDLNFKLFPSIQELREVKVSAGIGDKMKKTESIPVQFIGAEFLNEAKASNLMQTLNSIPGIGSMDIGTGISKPMIRGMGYYRVVVAQNGIKHEGQQWSNHHGISIDQQSVNQVEIVKGPASLQYGSDAIGGVINISSVHIPAENGFEGELSFTGKTNTRWSGASADVAFRKGDFYSDIAVTHNGYGDFIIPVTDSFLLPAPVSSSEASHKVKLGNRIYNTAGKEQAVSLTTGIVKGWGNSYIEFSYYSNKTGFFDWQGLQQDSLRKLHSGKARDLNLPWQKIDNYSVYHFTNRYFNNDKLEIAFGYQANISSEYSYLSDRTGNRTNDLNHFRDLGNLELKLNLQAFSGNAFYTVNRLEKQKIKIGINTQYQLHKNDGYSHILPEYYRLSSGFFVTYQYRFTEKWILNSGIRFDYNIFEMNESLNPDPEYGDPVFNPSFRKTYPGSALSLGVNFLPGDNTIFKVNIGKSYRMPSAYELGAYGLHRHEGRFEKGDINNRPEQAWQLDLGFEQKWRWLKLSVSPFINYFTNYLFLNPTPTLRAEGQVYEYRQTRAMLAGGETSVDYLFLDKLNITLGAEYVYAVNLDLQTALPFTPPFNLQTGISYLFKDNRTFTKSKTGIELVSAARQKYTVPNELTTPGYNSLNLLAATEMRIGARHISLMFKVKNLLDNKYYNHISFYRRLRIPEPGRDLQLFVSIPFNDKIN